MPGVQSHEHHGGTAPGGVDEVLHAHGLRVTAQRRRVLAALGSGAHLTPDEVTSAVAADGGDPLAPSTVYRTLDALEEIGVVAHTHLTHGAPTYHLAGHSDHIHLVCRSCGAVGSVPLALAADLVAALRRETGFAAEPQHMGIHGTCARCLAGSPAAAGPPVPTADRPAPEDR